MRTARRSTGRSRTDRPNTFKANVYYTLKWWKFNTVLGLFQQVYSGTPLSSYISVWGAPVFVEGRGKFVRHDPRFLHRQLGARAPSPTPARLTSASPTSAPTRISK